MLFINECISSLDTSDPGSEDQVFRILHAWHLKFSTLMFRTSIPQFNILLYTHYFLHTWCFSAIWVSSHEFQNDYDKHCQLMPFVVIVSLRNYAIRWSSEEIREIWGYHCERRAWLYIWRLAKLLNRLVTEGLTYNHTCQWIQLFGSNTNS